jgi:SAM-dependent MidA family methyltransferase
LERFMKEALHHPEFGYYSSNIREVGGGGDFSTSATLDPNLARAIASWIVERASGWEWSTIPVIECGAGTGELARRVLSALPWKIRLRLRFIICETSPSLRRIQKKSLRFRGVIWVSSVAEGLRITKGRALIYSNELVDAFPCRVFRREANDWRELGVRIHEDGSLSEASFGPPVREEWFSRLGDLPEGQRIESHDAFRSWLGEWRRLWKEGSMLTIDYGDVAPSLQLGSPSGTLRAYWKHRRITGMETYARFGRQDLTADVNFTDLIRWGEDSGWTTEWLGSQAEFINSRCSSASRLGEAAKAFLVLEQSPGRNL